MFRFLPFLLLFPLLTAAQQPDSVATDSIFLRAQRLAVDGRGDEGRAIVARELSAAQAGSPRYIDALYWRAMLAATAADAERDYRRIVVEFSLSRKAEGALIGLAQLELARGDRVKAIQHLERLMLEHPSGVSRARASFWMARVFFEDGNVPRACARLEDAKRLTPSDQVEMRNQLDYYGQRCFGVDTAVVAAANPPARAEDSASRLPSARPADSALRVPAPASSGARTDTSPRAGAATSASAGAEFTLQIAAYNTRAAAEKLHASLHARGYEARVVRAGNLYRVRVGRYATRTAASEAARRLQSNRIDAFVTEAESP